MLTPLDEIFHAIHARTRWGGPNSASKYGPHVAAAPAGADLDNVQPPIQLLVSTARWLAERVPSSPEDVVVLIA